MKKNRLRWLNLSKPHYILAALFLCLASLFTFSSCADSDDLHDMDALLVIFQFKNFGSASGEYAIPGNFDNWDNTTSDVTLSNGAGTSKKIAVTTANIQFSLVPTGTWERDWFEVGKVYGNGTDAGKLQNFYINGLDLDATSVTIVVDASNGSVTAQ